MTLQDKIQKLKKEKNALILAHNYVRDELQKAADYVGDSLELSRKAAQTNADFIVFCGVKFMAETAKILSPQATVLLPNLNAGCPMADNVEMENLQNFKSKNPDYKYIAYVNTTAQLKAEIDICCTSANVRKIIDSFDPEQNILFIPDKNLGQNALKDTKRKNMKLWNGVCPIHNKITIQMLCDAKKKISGRYDPHPPGGTSGNNTIC